MTSFDCKRSSSPLREVHVKGSLGYVPLSHTFQPPSGLRRFASRFVLTLEGCLLSAQKIKCLQKTRGL